MRKIGKVILLCLPLILFSSINAQEIKFKSYKSSDGVMAQNINGIYSWGPWLEKTAKITIDLANEKVYVGDTIYEIIEKPKKWVIKKDLKYVSFACTDKNFSKINVKLYQYDKGEFRVYVMGEKKATRYSVIYLE